MEQDSTERDTAVPSSTVLDATGRNSFRQDWLLANIWLLFLLFPAFTVLVDDLSLSRKAGSLILIAAFAVTHMLAYRDITRRWLGLDPEPGPNRNRWWFTALVAINAVAFLVGSWPLLAVLPFIVSFAMFHFTWRTGAIVGLLSVSTVIILPAFAGVLSHVWFFSIVVLSVGAATGMTRLSEESHTERSLLLRQLAVSQERDRVARDVHDVLGHSLTVVILKTQVCDRLLESLDGTASGQATEPAVSTVVEQARAQLAEVESVGRRALTEIRATVGGLRSADLANELAAARVVLADAGVELVVNGEASQITIDERSLLGWVVREAVTNVVRHAQATRCQITLTPTDVSAGERVLLRISDDGVGLGSSRPGNGLAGLQERVEANGATLRVTSGGETSTSKPATTGTVIEVLIPASEIGF
ncbi:MAG: sensor histidine kinase [Acidimicrobiales bacterium]